jgi:ADP-dependent NAD(P)H-hydrate dehydratase / NAD(P)H-hydrate epimerase
MHRVLPPVRGWPLFDSARTRRIETDAATGLPQETLMQRAGLAVARLALALAPHARSVTVFAGPGNNGGDGFEAALHLLRWGKRVDVVTLADAARQPADAHAALQRAQAAGVPIRSLDAAAHAPDFAIDALLGIGVQRPLQGLMQEAVRQVNRLGCPVLAIDVPSGLNADTGAASTDAVLAQHTLSLLTLKPGLLTAMGRDHTGTLWFDDLGVVDTGIEPSAWLSGAGDIEAQSFARRHAHHKGSFGDVAVIGGASGMGGAAVLAARAASAAGAGRVYLDQLGANAALQIDSLHPEIMCRPGWARDAAPSDLAGRLVVCGCGGGDAVRNVLPRLLSLTRRLVLDADALNAISADSSLRALLTARHGRGLASVLTPHPLEAARLLGCSTQDVQADRLASATRIAQELGCVVVLKGSGTVITSAGRVPVINATGNAALASAGTGDVLAGWLGGHWSQFGAPKAPHEAAFDAACAAVYRHGQAADPVRGGPLRASDLIERMHRLDSGAD